MHPEPRQRIAALAKQQVGRPFRLYGKDPVHGFDCVGLVHYVLSQQGAVLPDLPCYTAHGPALCAWHGYLQDFGLGGPNIGGSPETGDILLARPGPAQHHLLIHVGDGLVHAHMGLRKVVYSPFGLDWPVDSHWRWLG